MVQLTERLQVVDISGSAAQKWCFFGCLPFSKGAPFFLPPKARRESFNVNVVAEEFLTETQYVSGDLITPKCHYSVHYTRLMETYRPVNAAWATDASSGRAPTVNHNLRDVDFADNAIKHVSEVAASNVEYTVVVVLHSERGSTLPVLFEQTPCGSFCGKMLVWRRGWWENDEGNGPPGKWLTRCGGKWNWNVRKRNN